MNAQNSRSKELLEKVYDHLDSIDVSTLSMNEMKDFLEVVQKGQFLESYGQMPSFGFGGFGGPGGSYRGGGAGYYGGAGGVGGANSAPDEAQQEPSLGL